MSEELIPVYYGQVLSPADPASLKEAFPKLVDVIIQKADSNIIDWGTSVIRSHRILNDEGQELIYMYMVVEAIAVNL